MKNEVRKKLANAALSLLIVLGSVTTSIIISSMVPGAAAENPSSANVFAGDAYTRSSASALGGVRHFRLGLVSDATTTSGLNRAGWDIAPGVTPTFVFNQWFTGTAAPAAPPGSTTNAADSCILDIYRDNSATVEATLFSSTGTSMTCPANGATYSSWTPTKAGTYRLRVRIVQAGEITDNYNTDTDTGDATHTKGAMRVGMDFTSLTMSAYPSGSTFAYTVAGEAMTVTLAHTVTYSDMSTRNINIKTIDGTPTTIETNVVAAATGGSTTSAFAVSDTYPAASTSMGVEVTITATSTLTGVKWTHVNSVTSPITSIGSNSDTIRHTGFYNVDPRVTATHLIQLNDNAFGTGPMTKDHADGKRLTSDIAFRAVRFTNARSEGLNGLTVTLTLADSGALVSPVSNAGLSTATEGGEVGWTNPLEAWTDALPGGAWTQTADITSPSSIDGNSYLLTSTRTFTLLASDPAIAIAIGAGDASRPTAGWQPGQELDIVAGMTKDASKVAFTTASFSVLRFNPATGQPEYLASTNPSVWSTGDPFATYAMSASPGDAKLAIKSFTTAETSDWTYQDLAIIVKMVDTGGTPYSRAYTLSVEQATGGDPVHVDASPGIAIPGESVLFQIHEAFLSGQARTGNAAGTDVYVYQPDGTLVASPAELGTNVGFETYTTTPGVPDSWTSSGGTGVAFAKETTIIHGGSNAVKVTAGGTTDQGLYQAAPNTAGMTYGVKVWARTSGAASEQAALIVYDVTASSNIFTATGTTSTTTYAQLSGTYTAVAGHTYRILLTHNTAASGRIVYFDDVTVTPHPTEIQFGAYTYSYPLSSSAAAGSWYVIAKTTDSVTGNVNSASTTFYVRNDQAQYAPSFIAPSTATFNSGSAKTFKVNFNLFGPGGSLVDPTSNQVDVAVTDQGGSAPTGITLAGSPAGRMTRDALGQYSIIVTVGTTAVPDTQLVLKATYALLGSSRVAVAQTVVVDYSQALDDIATQLTALQSDVTTVKTNVAAIVTKWGTTDAATLLSNIQGVQTNLGVSTDASSAATVFGKIQSLREHTDSNDATTQSAISSLQTTANTISTNLNTLAAATSALVAVPSVYSIPSSGSTTFQIDMLLKDIDGSTTSLVDPTSNQVDVAITGGTPTGITLAGSPAGRFTRNAQGDYSLQVTVASTAAINTQLRFKITYVYGGVTHTAVANTMLVKDGQTFDVATSLAATNVPTLSAPALGNVPASGTSTFRLDFAVYDIDGGMLDPTSNQVDIAVVNAAGSTPTGVTLGGSPAGRMTRDAAGLYSLIVTASTSAVANDALTFKATYAASSITRTVVAHTVMVDYSKQFADVVTRLTNIQADTDALQVDTAAILAKWGTTDAATLLSNIQTVQTRLGQSSDASSASTVFGKIQSLREHTDSNDATTQAAIATLQTTATNIQTTVNEVAGSSTEALLAPAVYEIPSSGSTTLQLKFLLKNADTASAELVDPDSNQVDITVLNQAGSTPTGVTLGGSPAGRMTRDAQGDYSLTVTVASTAVANDMLSFKAAFTKGSVARVARAMTALDDSAVQFAFLKSFLIRDQGTAQAGASTSITLASTASASDSYYLGAVVYIYSGTGAGQARIISAYTGSTRVATISRSWVTNPTSSSLYVIHSTTDLPPLDGALRQNVNILGSDSVYVHVGTAQAGASTTITLTSGASATDDFYTGLPIHIYSGTGIGQIRTITGYVGSTKVATVDRAWSTNPTSASSYRVMAQPQLWIGSSLALVGLQNDLTTTKANTATIITKWGSTDAATLLSNIQDVQTRLGASTDGSGVASVFGKIADLKATTNSNDATTQANIATLQTTANTISTNLNTLAAASHALLEAPSIVPVPVSGSSTFVVGLLLRDIDGSATQLVDPTSNQIDITVVNQAGSAPTGVTLGGSPAGRMTRNAQGDYSLTVTTASTAVPGDQLRFTFTYTKGGVTHVAKVSTMLETATSTLKTSIDTLAAAGKSALAVPSIIEIPTTGDTQYVRLDFVFISNSGALADPDSNQVDVDVKDETGSNPVGIGLGGSPAGRMTRLATGQYTLLVYAASDTAPYATLAFRASYAKSGVSGQAIASMHVSNTRNDFDSISTPFDDLTTLINSVKDDTASIKTTVEGIDTAVADLNTDTISAQLDDLTTLLGASTDVDSDPTLFGKVAELKVILQNGDVQEILDQVNQVQSVLDTLRSEVGANGQARTVYGYSAYLEGLINNLQAGLDTFSNVANGNLIAPSQVHIPTSGSSTVKLDLYIEDLNAYPDLYVDPVSNQIDVAVVNQAGAAPTGVTLGGSPAGRMTRSSQGFYTLTVAIASTATANDQLRFTASYTYNSQTQKIMAYTVLEDLDGKFAGLSTQVTNLQTDVTTIKSSTDAIVTKWGSTDAATLLSNIQTVQTRLGTSSDGSGVASVFGKIADLKATTNSNDATTQANIATLQTTATNTQTTLNQLAGSSEAVILGPTLYQIPFQGSNTFKLRFLLRNVNTASADLADPDSNQVDIAVLNQASVAPVGVTLGGSPAGRMTRDAQGDYSIIVTVANTATAGDVLSFAATFTKGSVARKAGFATGLVDTSAKLSRVMQGMDFDRNVANNLKMEWKLDETGFTDGAQLITNPGFETYTTTPGLPDSWSNNGLPSPSTDVTKETSNKRTGNNAVKITITNSDCGSNGIRESFAVTNAKSYYVEAWYKTGGSYAPQIFLSQPGGGLISGSSNGMIGVASTAGFTKISATFRASSTGSAILYLVDACNASGHIFYWDDVSVGEIQVKESTSTGAHGTIATSTANAAGPLPGIVGKWGYAYSFDGVDDYITVPTIASNRWIGTTMEAWIYPTTYAYADGFENVIGNTGSDILTIFHQKATNQYRCKVLTTVGSMNVVYSDATVVVNQWHHFACTYDGTTLNLYMDGASKATSTTNGGGPIASDATVGLGAQEDGTEHWAGSLDNIRIYNRALTSQEVAVRYDTYQPFTNLGTQLTNLQSDVTTVKTNVATIVTKWGSTDADTLLSNIQTVQTRLGTSADASSAATVFGKIQSLRERTDSNDATTQANIASLQTTANSVQTTLNNLAGSKEAVIVGPGQFQIPFQASQTFNLEFLLRNLNTATTGLADPDSNQVDIAVLNQAGVAPVGVTLAGSPAGRMTRTAAGDYSLQVTVANTATPYDVLTFTATYSQGAVARKTAFVVGLHDIAARLERVAQAIDIDRAVSTVNVLKLKLDETTGDVGSNLVANPGFETDTSGYSAAGSTISRDTGVFRSGVASLKAVPGGAGSSEGAQLTITGLVAGHSYYVEAWGRTDGTVTQSVRMIVFNSVDSTSLTPSTTGTAGSTTFEKLTRSFTAVAGKTYILLLYKNGGSSEVAPVYFDDITIKEIVATDSSSTGNHGTLKGGTNTYGPNVGATGKWGTGYSMDGADDYVQVADNSAFSIPTTGQLTVEAWVSRPTSGVNDDIFGKAGNPYEWNLNWVSSNRFSFQTWTSGGVSVGTLNGVRQVTDTALHHVVATIVTTSTTAGTITLYVDGVLDATTTYSGSNAISDTSSPVFLGQRGDGGGNGYFGGIVDEARIYSRALTSKEVAVRYDSYQPFATIDASLATLQSDMTTVKTNVQTIVNKWGTTDAATLLTNIQDVQTRIGTSSDTSSANTVFGKVADLKATTTADDASLTTAISSLNTLVTSFRAEVGAQGQSATAYALLQAIQTRADKILIGLDFDRTAGAAVVGQWNFDEATGTDGNNLVANAAFETYTTSPGAPDSWGIRAGVSGNIFKETSIVHGGSNAVKMVQDATPTNTAIQQVALAVTAGHSYYVEGWIRTGGTGTARLQLHQETDAIGVLVMDTTSSTYTKVSGTFTAVSGKSYTIIARVVGGSAGDIAYADDIIVKEIQAKDTSVVGTSHGVLKGATNTAGPTINVAGRWGKAYSFDGTDDAVTASFATTFNPSTTGVSVEAWLNPTSVASGVRVASNGNGAQPYIGRSGSAAILSWYDSSATQRTLTGGTLVAGSYNHVVGTNDGATATLYVNGVQVNQQTGTTLRDFQLTGWNFGGFTDFPSNPWTGSIDGARVYSRALSSKEVAMRYDSQQLFTNLETQITSVSTQITNLQSDVTTIKTNVATIVAKWGSTDAATLLTNIQDVQTRLGTSSDSSSAATVFGKIADLKSTTNTNDGVTQAAIATLQSTANSIQTTLNQVSGSSEALLVGPTVYQIPATGSATFQLKFMLRNTNTASSGLSDPDSNQVDIAVTNQAGSTPTGITLGGSPAGRLTRDAQGAYTLIVTATSSAVPNDILTFKATYMKGSVARETRAITGLSDMDVQFATLNSIMVRNSGIAQAGTSTSITLATSASTTANLYIGSIVYLTGGTGAGQARVITSYTTGRIAGTSRTWAVTPDSSTTYVLYATSDAPFVDPSLQVGLRALDINYVASGNLQAATSTTVTLASFAAATDDYYTGMPIHIYAGTGSGQVRTIIGYVGSTRVATVDRPWSITLDSGSTYKVLSMPQLWISGSIALIGLQNDLTTTKANTATLVAKWGTYDAAQLATAIGTLASNVGAPSDTSSANTVFGKIAAFRAEASTNSNSALAAIALVQAKADATYTLLDELHTEVGAHGKAHTVYAYLELIDAMTSSISDDVASSRTDILAGQAESRDTILARIDDLEAANQFRYDTMLAQLHVMWGTVNETLEDIAGLAAFEDSISATLDRHEAHMMQFWADMNDTLQGAEDDRQAKFDDIMAGLTTQTTALTATLHSDRDLIMSNVTTNLNHHHELMMQAFADADSDEQTRFADLKDFITAHTDNRTRDTVLQFWQNENATWNDWRTYYVDNKDLIVADINQTVAWTHENYFKKYGAVVQEYSALTIGGLGEEILKNRQEIEQGKDASFSSLVWSTITIDMVKYVLYGVAGAIILNGLTSARLRNSLKRWTPIGRSIEAGEAARRLQAEKDVKAKRSPLHSARDWAPGHMGGDGQRE